MSAYDLSRKPRTVEEELRAEIKKLWERVAKLEDDVSMIKARSDRRWDCTPKPKQSAQEKKP